MVSYFPEYNDPRETWTLEVNIIILYKKKRKIHEFRQAPAIKFRLPLCQMRTAETMQTVGTHQEETCAALLLYMLYQDKKRRQSVVIARWYTYRRTCVT